MYPDNLTKNRNNVTGFLIRTRSIFRARSAPSQNCFSLFFVFRKKVLRFFVLNALSKILIRRN